MWERERDSEKEREKNSVWERGRFRETAKEKFSVGAREIQSKSERESE